MVRPLSTLPYADLSPRVGAPAASCRRNGCRDPGACECRPLTSSQAKFDGYLFSCPAECQCQGAREGIEPGQEPQGKFLVPVVTRAAAELAQVHAAEVVFGVDRHGGPFTVPVGAVGPPARFGA